jgi:2-polyprenyl-3-methyl-5-hydroxy-6-metoxy-1,4-benzoquinol methylase
MTAEDKPAPPIELQRNFWNAWNTSTREKVVGDVSLRQQEVLLGWLKGLGRKDLKIIDFGCGAGWLCQQLQEFGTVTGVDLADDALARARERMPAVTFIAGDIMTLDLGVETFDVVVTLEVLSHIADQEAFVERLSRLLRPGGLLILATQNRPILKRNESVKPAQPGQLRHWVDSHELRKLVSARFKVKSLRSLTPMGHQGFLRYLNAYKLTAMLDGVFGQRRVAAVKEWLGLGWTLMVLAQKPAKA